MPRDLDSWWPEETIHAGREHFDEQHTRRYDAKEDELGAAGNVEVAHARFLTYRHSGPPADLVYSRYALHHLPDFWKAIALVRAADMLRSGGVLRLWDVVYGFEPQDADRHIEAWIAHTMAADVEHGWTRAELASTCA